MNRNIIRAWKDPAYRAQLQAETGAVIDHPAGLRSLTEKELQLVNGAGGSYVATTCTGSAGDCCAIILGDCDC